MVQTLEAIHGGGGSIRVGTTGKIAVLITREMDRLKQMPQTSTSRKKQTVPVSVPCRGIPGRSLPRSSAIKASSSSSSSSSINNNNRNSSRTSSNHRTPRNTPRTKSSIQKSDHHIPMLSSQDIPLDRAPGRGKPKNKGPHIVEVVDVKCGILDKAWSSPIATRLKKLGFSKLSETIA